MSHEECLQNSGKLLFSFCRGAGAAAGSDVTAASGVREDAQVRQGASSSGSGPACASEVRPGRRPRLQGAHPAPGPPPQEPQPVRPPRGGSSGPGRFLLGCRLLCDVCPWEKKREAGEVDTHARMHTYTPTHARTHTQRHLTRVLSGAWQPRTRWQGETSQTSRPPRPGPASAPDGRPHALTLRLAAALAAEGRRRETRFSSGAGRPAGGSVW